MFAPIPNDRVATGSAADPSLYSPYVNSWSLRIQRLLIKKIIVSVAYVGNKGTGQYRGWNIEQMKIGDNGFLSAFQAAQRNLVKNGSPNVGESVGVLGRIFPATSTANVASIPASANTTISQGQVGLLANQIDKGLVGTLPAGGLVAAAGLPDNFFRANPQYNAAWILGDNTNSTYHAMKLEVTRRLSEGVYFQGNYTFSKALTDYIGGQSQASAYRDNANRQLDKKLSSFDATHVINANALVQLPFGKGKHWLNNAPGLVNHVVGGWQVNTLFGFTTGTPVTVSSGRANLTTDSSTADYAGTDYHIFNKVIRGNQITDLTPQDKLLFTSPAAGSPGGTAQLAFRGLNFWNYDTSFFKEFQIAEQKRLQMRFEIFNILNMVRFSGLSTTSTSSTFGTISSTMNPRIMQFAAKITF
jgi:hypothetical protein